jgi:flagellar biosynthesis protein FlhG
MSTQLEGLRHFVASRPASTHPADHSGPVVVGSGKGGTGTSTLAALIALLASADGASVLLIDAADGLGAQHMLFGVRPAHGLAALRGGGAQPHDLVVPLTDRLALLAAAADPAEPDQLSPAERRALLQRFSVLHREFDLVVIDGGSRLESVAAACASGASRLIAVTTADRIAMATTYALFKATRARFGTLDCEVLVNRADEQTGRTAHAELVAAADRFGESRPGFAGAVPEDACLAAGIAAGMPLHEAAVGSPAAHASLPLARRLIPGPRSLRAAG